MGSALDWFLFRICAALLAVPLACEGLFGTTLLAWLQVKGMTLDFLNDVFLLDLPLEPAKRAFQGFSVLDMDFSQKISPRFQPFQCSRATKCLAGKGRGGTLGVEEQPPPRSVLPAVT